MSIITPYINNLKTLESKIYEVAKQAVLDNRETIVDLVKHGQLEKGINSFGKIIGRYAVSTSGYAKADGISIPKTFGAPYNMYWTGETIENLYMKSVNKQKAEYNISTVAGKKKLLESEYGIIFDLTKEHNEWVNDNLILPAIQKFILDNLLRVG